MTIIQNNLMRLRDYDPVALPEHYWPVSHPKLSRAGPGGEAGVPAPDGRRTRLMIFFISGADTRVFTAKLLIIIYD